MNNHKNDYPIDENPTDEIHAVAPVQHELVQDEQIDQGRRRFLRNVLAGAGLAAVAAVASQIPTSRKVSGEAVASPEQSPTPTQSEGTESYMSTEKFGAQYMGTLVTAMQAKNDRIALASTVAKENGQRLTPGDDPVLWGNHLGMDDATVEPDTLPDDSMTNNAYRYIEFHPNGRGFATWMGKVGRSTRMRVSFTYEPLPDGKLPTNEDLLHTVGPSLKIDSLTWATISDDGKERESGSFETIPNGGPNREDDAQISLNDQQITDPAKRADEYTRVDVLIAELQLASDN